MVDVATDAYVGNILTWTLFAVATPFVFIRLWVQLRLRTRPWPELWVATAYLCLLIYTILNSLYIGWDVFNLDIPWNPQHPSFYRANKAYFGSYFVYKPIVYACKAALLCLYMDLAPRQMRKIWLAIWASWAWLAIGFLFLIIYLLSGCGRHIEANWTLENAHCPPPSNNKIMTASWTIHLFTDLLVFILPFFILRGLPGLHTKQKHTAYAMFGLGTLNIACAVVTTVLYIITRFTSYHYKAIYFWYNICVQFQAGSAVIIICIPYLRRFWKGTKFVGAEPGVTQSRIARMMDAIGRTKTPNSDLESCVASTSTTPPRRVVTVSKATQIQPKLEVTVIAKAKGTGPDEK